jgi:hypothetical protein
VPPDEQQVSPESTTAPAEANKESQRTPTGKTTVILEETAHIREELRKNASKLLHNLLDKHKK